MITTDAGKVLSVLNEISNCLTRMEGERDAMKEIISKAAEDHQIPKKTLRKMARIHHKGNANQEKAEVEEVFSLYETVQNKLPNNK